METQVKRPCIRLLRNEDMTQYIYLINAFTPFGCIKEIEREDFEKWLALSNCNNSYIYVMMRGKRMIGTGKLLIEYKFNRGLTKAGHIEDIVIDPCYRGHGYGQKMVKFLLNSAKERGCYKVTLSCDEGLLGFYKRCGEGLDVRFGYGVKYYL